MIRKSDLGILLFIRLSSINLNFAQAPQGIPYQAVARNLQGQPLANKNIAVRFSVLDSIATGPAVYSEMHLSTTSNLGLFNLNVGMGATVSGTFSSINWGVNSKFLKVELDTTALGTNYMDLGSQQMMSVPYALYAGKTFEQYSSTSTQTHIAVFDSSGIFVATSGIRKVFVEIWGGGAGGNGGQGGYNFSRGGVGGPAGCYESGIINITPGDSILVEVGVGGNGGSFNNLGQPGGNSSFGSFIVAYGGNNPSQNINCDYAQASYGVNDTQGSKGGRSISGGRGGTGAYDRTQIGEEGKVPGGGGGGGPIYNGYYGIGSNGGRGADGLVVIHF